MHWSLLTPILVLTAVAAVVPIWLLSLEFGPLDLVVIFCVDLWLAAPAIFAAGLAILFRRRSAVLIGLLAALLLAVPASCAAIHFMTDTVALAKRNVATAVLPGESPDSGPGGMRKAGADMGLLTTQSVTALTVLAIPPAQFVVVLFGFATGFGVSSARGRVQETDPPGLR